MFSSHLKIIYCKQASLQLCRVPGLLFYLFISLWPKNKLVSSVNNKMSGDLSFVKCHLHILKITKDLEPILVGPQNLQLTNF